MSTRVLLVDDHKIVRDGLRNLLAGELGMDVVGEADNGRDAVRLARELSPDVVVMDVGMTGLNGIEATRQIVSEANGPKVVALSMHAERRFVAEMLKAGATGYLPKDCAFGELAEAIRSAVAGRTYLSPAIAGEVVEDYVRRLSRAGEDEGRVSVSDALSPREREVLQLVAEGNSTKEIAATLHLSAKTVETHRRQMMVKLKIDSVAGLVKFAVREGLTTLDS